LLPGYPGTVDARQAAGVRDQVDALAAFQAELRTLRAMPLSLRKGQTKALAAKYPAATAVHVVAVGLVRALVDVVDGSPGWQDVLDYIEALDGAVASDPYVREQRALALGKVGRPQDAIAELLALIDVAGDSAERQGLLGGRFKELMRSAENAGRPAADVSDFRREAIAHYERGMMLDLNDFYPTSNLPRLYRLRGEAGDESRAQTALQVTSAACERAIARGSADEWVRPTLLGIAFDLGDARKAQDAAEIARRAATDTATLARLEMSLAEVADPSARDRLRAVLDDLRCQQ